jgi:murein DD-endopeptidase MepM/ murein hydrolase activator NlpD
MKKQKYRYNPQSLSFERIETPFKIVLLKGFAVLCTIAISSLALYFFLSKHISTPKEKALQRELAQMEFNYAQMNDQIENLSKVINNLHQRDSRVYEIVFGMEPVDDNIWESGVGGHERFSNLTHYGKSTEIIKQANTKLDKLERQVVIHSTSLEEVEDVAQRREEMLKAMPSIKPVRGDFLKRDVKLLSGFGMRMHPLHKVMKMHAGIDFTCPSGTSIQATGNGTVVDIQHRKSGYGTSILIDHGFGYETLYAHCSKVIVKKGEKVVKGQKIAEVGNTGTSTAPHCHYEVRFQGRAVNPIHYVMDGLTPDEYAELVELASITNQSFD